MSSSTASFLASSLKGEACSLSPRDAVFIDAGVDQAEVLLQGKMAATAVYRLNQHEDAIAQISKVLAEQPQVKRIHLVAHGAPGLLRLGSGELSLETLDRYAPQLKAWFANSAHQLSLYGCNVAAGDAGAEFIEKLHGMTGAAIAASTTPIGQADLGGNWELDAAYPTPQLSNAPTLKRPNSQTPQLPHSPIPQLSK